MERLIELLENILGQGKTTNRGNHAFRCPFCNSNEKKLEVQITSSIEGENHFHCWKCNASGKKDNGRTILYVFIHEDFIDDIR